jgi:hypothetical protein
LTEDPAAAVYARARIAAQMPDAVSEADREQWNRDHPVSERADEDRAAAITALTATLNLRLSEDEAWAKRATPGPWHIPEHDPLFYCVDSPDGSGRICTFGDRAAGDDVNNSLHIARHDPARVLRDVQAKRDLLAAILREPHTFIPGDEYYSCSQAVDGSGCSDPDRAGKPCDCGRDARVERLLAILAGVYEAHTANGEQR